MFKVYLLTDQQQFVEHHSRTSTYKICLQNKELGRIMTEEQKKQIQDKLFKQPHARETAKPEKMKKQQQQANVNSSTSSLYKLSLRYILN